MLKKTSRKVCVLVVVVVLFTACGSGPPATQALSTEKTSHKPVWVEAVPKGCRVGVSGPTMVAAHALRLARRRAIAPFARDRAAVRLKSASVFIENRTQSHYREVTTQASRTDVSGVFVVAIYRDLGSDRVFALVCDQAQARPPSMPVFEGAPWAMWNGQPTCALGVSLRAQSIEEQRTLALADAKRQLAITLGAQVDEQVLDDTRGRDGLLDSVLIKPLATSTSRVSELKPKWWLDEMGKGPLRKPAVLYALLCL
ncbi:MAG: hypothetical protein ACON3Z_12860 [Bradymonadia bacterium]